MGERSQHLPGIRAFSELRIKYPQPEELLNSAEEAAAALRRAVDPDEIKLRILAFQQELLAWESAASLSRLKSAEGQINPQEESFFVREAAIPEQARAIFYRALLNSRYEHVEHSGEDRDLWSEAWRWSRFRDAVSPDTWAREAALERRLRDLCPECLHQSIQGGNAFFSLSELASRKQLSRELCDDLNEKKCEREALFLELIALRRELAGRCSYPHYSAYHAALRGRRDFSRREMRGFVQSFQHHFLPLYRELRRQRNLRLGTEIYRASDLLTLMDEADPAASLESSQLAPYLGRCLEIMSGEAQSFVAGLLDEGYVSFSPKTAAAFGEATVLFPSEPSAFFLLPAEEPFAPLSRTLFRLGEGLADVSAMLNYHVLGASRQDELTRKISACFFFFLSAERLVEAYGPRAELAEDLFLSRLFLILPLYFALFEMEERIFTTGAILSAKDLSREWMELCERWFPDLEEAEGEFLLQNEAWEILLPLTGGVYRSLALPMALVTVLAEHPFRQKQRHLAASLNGLLLSNPGSPVFERFKLADLSVPWDKACMQRAAFSLCDRLAL